MFSWDKDRRKRYQLFIDGEGEGEQGVGGSAGVVEEGSQEGQQSSNGSGGNQRGSQQVPYERFSQVNREKQELAKQVEAYKKYGSVEDVERAIQRAKDSGKFTKTEQDALDADLLAGSKTFRENNEFVKVLKEREAKAATAFENSAISKASGYIKSLGLQFKNDGERVRYERGAQALMADLIKVEPGWLDRFVNRDMTVVEDAWKAIKHLYDGVRRSQNATIQASKLQQGVRPGVSGAANKEGDKGDGIPRTADGRIDERAVLAKASDRGFARLKASEE